MPRTVRPLIAASTCPAARDYSRAYLHHLVKSGEYLGAMLLSWANVAFYQELMGAMRAAIAAGRFGAWEAETRARLARVARGARTSEGRPLVEKSNAAPRWPRPTWSSDCGVAA